MTTKLSGQHHEHRLGKTESECSSSYSDGRKHSRLALGGLLNYLLVLLWFGNAHRRGVLVVSIKAEELMDFASCIGVMPPKLGKYLDDNKSTR